MNKKDHLKRVGPGNERRTNMNVTKGIAVLTLAALAITPQGVQGGRINYIVSEDTLTELKLTVDHPGSTFSTSGDRHMVLAPPLTNWKVGGFLVDHNAPLFTRGIDTVSIKHLRIEHTGIANGPEFYVFNVTASGPPVKENYTISLIEFAQSQKHGANFDNVEVTGTFKGHGTLLGGSDIDAYNFVVVGDHSGAEKFALASSLAGSNESTQVSTTAFGSLAGLYHADTNQLNLEIGLVGLQASNITGIQITSSAPGFTTLNLGTSALMDGSNGVAFGGDFSIPLADLGAIEAGNAFVNVLTHNYPNGEIGGTLSTVQTPSVPEPSSFLLLASGLAGLAWWRRKIAA
jgi:hypothetical protein